MATAALAVNLFAKLHTGDDRIDSLRMPIIYGVLRALHPVTPAQWTNAIQVARGLCLVAHAEVSFDGAVGDTVPSLAPGGPSISPWQIERINAIAKGYYTPPLGVIQGSAADRAAYAAIDTTGVGAYEWAFHAADFFATEVWATADNFADALAVWNGGPNGVNNAAAISYGARGAELASTLGWA